MIHFEKSYIQLFSAVVCKVPVECRKIVPDAKVQLQFMKCVGKIRKRFPAMADTVLENDS